MRFAAIKKLGLALGLAAGVGLAGNAQAQGADALLDLLVQKGVINQREANEVRSQLDAQTAAAVDAYSKTKASSFLDSLKLSGDLRLRAELFDNQDQSVKIDRWRFRYRLRLGVEAALPSWAKIKVRLASGGDEDPVSTNQTLTDTFRNKPVSVDTAYAVIQPPGWDWISVLAGKMDNPIWQPSFNSPMVWDTDATPEGLAEQLTFSFGEHQQFRVFGNFGQFILEEISGDANDAGMFDLQAGFQAGFGGELPKNPRLKLLAAAGILQTHNIESISGFDSGNKGNAAVANRFIDDFEVLYLRGEVGWQISERPFLGTPCLLSFSGEYVNNLAEGYGDLADDQTEGWTVQAAFGSTKKKGQWLAAYQYKYLEADAVWDAITDSDWGLGGTDRKGHVLKAVYNLQDWWQLGITAFLTEKISNRPNSGHNTVGLADKDLLRIQMDSAFKF